MRFHLLTFLLLATPFTSANTTPPPQTSLTFHLPPTFPGGALSLSPQSTLHLTTTGKHFTALLTKFGTFDLTNITTGSYLADISSREWVFAPLRVDVQTLADGRIIVDSALSFRGNEWSNTGEKRRGDKIELVPVRKVEYYIQREGFSPMKLLGSPMILIAIVSLGAMYFIPKLIDNMDPELKAEFQEAQKRTLAGQQGFGGPGRNPVEGFDIAGYLSGSGNGGSSSSGGKKK
ncbi:hypothetical protein L211DRAFT_821468 [Terfezia boudieri ATCC MYA-4762]|uniref:ER membrane protein complex subunit 7 beta-sandwich domain-containing protein n=1 Tax=Terfezia boudieri ATCC MYA-4762 TaxID=1051890 RepID=A0A3N4LZ12_9PEZI|nr:hypothetical protein L211DRAFT_821468 [Terfezia boudieri ATCC MYA-4762]